MPIDYLGTFPIPVAVLPLKLRNLLESVGTEPGLKVEVSARYEHDLYGPDEESLHMLMAVVPEEDIDALQMLDEISDGVVEYSTPVLGAKGNTRNFMPSVSGHDYVVASWGSSSFYTYTLAEKVWMALGLTPRCIGNDAQRLIYDDLTLPEFGVAEGEVSGEFHWNASRNISWLMSNEYLRKYLWMRGSCGVRVFYYQANLPDTPELRALMNGEEYVSLKPDEAWYELDIRQEDGGLAIEVWGTVVAVTPQLSTDLTADGIEWPDIEGPMNHARANGLMHGHVVLLNDKFIERYEQSSFYDTVPVQMHQRWHCSPSYRGQWTFTDCVRVGRNLVQVPIRELYKPKPDREIVHARKFAISVVDAAQFDRHEENIVAKTQRLLDQILDLGDNLSALGAKVGLERAAVDLVGFSRAKIAANGWGEYPQLCRLAQVAPLEMNQQSFLSRCKNLHEIWQRVPDGFMKSLLEKGGCPRALTRELRSLKLLQALLHIVERLDTNNEASDAFESTVEPDGWTENHAGMAALFLNNDLRIADAHDTFGDALQTLQTLGFDIANVNQGYGRALDFVMDGVIGSLATINRPLHSMLQR